MSKRNFKGAYRGWEIRLEKSNSSVTFKIDNNCSLTGQRSPRQAKTYHSGGCPNSKLKGSPITEYGVGEFV